MILVDTSVLVAWLDPSHEHHKKCWAAIRTAAANHELAVSSVTYGELAAGARTLQWVDEALSEFTRLDLDFPSAWRAGQAFRKYRSTNADKPVLPDFFIRAQAATLSLPHLTNDRRRLTSWPDVDFLFPSI